MVHLDLSDEDTRILRATLESYLSDLRYEIANTDRMAFRDELKEKKRILNKVVEMLDGGAAPL